MKTPHWTCATQAPAPALADTTGLALPLAVAFPLLAGALSGRVILMWSGASAPNTAHRATMTQAMRAICWPRQLPRPWPAGVPASAQNRGSSAMKRGALSHHHPTRTSIFPFCSRTSYVPSGSVAGPRKTLPFLTIELRPVASRHQRRAPEQPSQQWATFVNIIEGVKLPPTLARPGPPPWPGCSPPAHRPPAASLARLRACFHPLAG